MAFKIEIISDNALRVTNTTTGDIEISQPKLYTWYEEDSLVAGYVKFYGTTDKVNLQTNKYTYNKQGNDFKGYPIEECVNELDVAFTIETFRTFADPILGKLSGGAASLTTDNFFVADYADTSTTASPINISVGNVNVNTWIDLPNNGLGAGSFNDLPNGVDIIDVLTGYFDFTSIPQGSKIDIRLDLTVTTTTPNTVIQARLLQAVGDALERPVIFAHRYYKSAITAVSYVFSTTFDVTSDAFYLNLSKLQVLADDASVIINNGVRCWVTYKQNESNS